MTRKRERKGRVAWYRQTVNLYSLGPPVSLTKVTSPFLSYVSIYSVTETTAGYDKETGGHQRS